MVGTGSGKTAPHFWHQFSGRWPLESKGGSGVPQDGHSSMMKGGAEGGATSSELGDGSGEQEGDS